jgi:two-component system phosphate regulon sensor histidine kinase PhoR
MATEAQSPAVTDRQERPAQSRRRIFLVVFTSFLVIIGVAAFATLRLTENFWQNALREIITRDLTQKAELFASRVNTDRVTNIADLASQVGQQAGARATVVDGNGKVLADSQAPLAALEHEGEHPEFAAALRGEIGIQTRGRGAFGFPVLYVAVPVSGGAVRLAYPLADLEAAQLEAKRVLILGCLIAVLAALVISLLTARTLAPR